MDTDNLIKNKEWTHYLTRPFNLFSTSLWYRWYSQPKTIELFEVNMPDAMFIQEKVSSVRQYRIKDQLEKFNVSTEQFLVKNSQKCKEALEQGLVLNNQARKMLTDIDSIPNSLEDLLSYLDSLLLFSTILPFFTYENIMKLGIKDDELLSLSESLRKESYYMDILNKIVLPKAKKQVKTFSSIDPDQVIEVITAKEILLGVPLDLQSRIDNRKENNFFVYQMLDGEEKVYWLKDPLLIIQKIEKLESDPDILEIAGQTACLGRVKGKARIIFDPSKKAEFDKGDVLVTINSNPSFMALIKKCAAIVADEGGMTCHAAIISRELNIPCIVGTKIGTKVLKEGGMIEVDANKGIVRILNK